MKKISYLALALSTVLPLVQPSQAEVLYVTSITTNPALTPDASTNLILTSLTTGSGASETTFTDFVAPSVVTGASGPFNYGSSIAPAQQPTSTAEALADLNIGTGSYNTGSNTQYSFSTDIDSLTTFFALSNSNTDYPVEIRAYNGSTQIGAFAPSISTGSTTPLGTLSLNSSVGNFTRTLYGFTFQASDFVFTGMNTASDITGVRLANAAFDVQAFGIAIPEPVTGSLALAGSLLVVVRRRLDRRGLQR